MSEATTELAVHLAAAAVQADAAALCDSESFMATVAGLGPDTPGFVGRVQAAIQEAVAAGRAQSQAPTAEDSSAPAPVVPQTRNQLLAAQAARRAQLTAQYEGDITVQDVADADARVVGEWAASGRLAHLGVPPQRRRGRR